MFTPEIRKIYFGHQPKYRERIKKQLRDHKFIIQTLNKNVDNLSIDSYSIMEKCAGDFKERVYNSGATKLRSVKAIAKFHNKYFHLKIDNDFVTYCVVPDKKGYNVLLSVIRPLKSERGIIYILHSPSNKTISLMHSHVVRRYGERFNGSTNLTECLNMLSKEMIHAKLNGEEEYTMMDLIKRGLVSSPLNIVVGSGILLADEILLQDKIVHFIKTYVPMGMLNNRQDNLHEELWNEIMEERSSRKVKAPFL